MLQGDRVRHAATRYPSPADHHVRDTAVAAGITGKRVFISAGTKFTDADGKVINPDAPVADLTLTNVVVTGTGRDANDAGAGLVKLTASGNIDVNAGLDYTYDYTRSTSSSGFIVEKTTTAEHTRETATAVPSLVSGSRVEIGAGDKGNLTFTAARIESADSITLSAGGAIKYLAAHNLTYENDETRTTKSLLGLVDFKKSEQSHTFSADQALVTEVQGETGASISPE